MDRNEETEFVSSTFSERVCNKSEEKALKDIEESGCHILLVKKEDDSPRFSASSGIENCELSLNLDNGSFGIKSAGKRVNL